MRRHLNYANVVATFALVFAMSGGALAAKHYLVSSPKQISPSVLKSLASSNTALFKKLSRTIIVANASSAVTARSADSATSAITATNATNAANATKAATATDASQLGGQAPGAYAQTAQPGFTNADLNAGFSNFLSGFAEAGFMKDTLGFVHLRGLMHCPESGVAFTLPPGDRPRQLLFMPLVVGGSGAGNVTIKDNGEVKVGVLVPGGAACGVDGIIFKAEQ